MELDDYITMIVNSITLLKLDIPNNIMNKFKYGIF